MITVIISSCNNNISNATPFEHDEITFNIPKNWQIVAQDSSEDNYFSISINMPEDNTSGFAFVEWNDSLFALKEVMDSTKTGFLAEPLFTKGGIKFQGEQETLFAGQKALSNKFSFNIQGVDYEGILYSFQLPACNRTVMVIFQQQSIDRKIQAPDFELIKNSFSCISTKK